MKQKTFTVLIFAITILSSNILAQKQGNNQDRVKQQTENMIKSLELDQEQAKQVEEINERFAEEGKSIRDQSSGDREAMRASMKELRDSRNAELKKVLTDEQYKKHLENEKEMRQKRMNNKGRGNNAR